MHRLLKGAEHNHGLSMNRLHFEEKSSLLFSFYKSLLNNSNQTLKSVQFPLDIKDSESMITFINESIEIV